MSVVQLRNTTGTTTTTTTTGCSSPSISDNNSDILLEIVKNYEKSIGIVTESVLDLLSEYLDIMPAAYIRYAITETGFAPAPSLRYFRAIIRRLVQEQPAVDTLGKEKPKPTIKTVREQQYTQREYQNTTGMTSRMSERLEALRSRS